MGSPSSVWRGGGTPRRGSRPSGPRGGMGQRRDAAFESRIPGWGRSRGSGMCGAVGPGVGPKAHGRAAVMLAGGMGRQGGVTGKKPGGRCGCGRCGCGRRGQWRRSPARCVVACAESEDGVDARGRDLVQAVHHGSDVVLALPGAVAAMGKRLGRPWVDEGLHDPLGRRRQLKLVAVT
jgi:hypothetical protein